MYSDIRQSGFASGRVPGIKKGRERLERFGIRKNIGTCFSMATQYIQILVQNELQKILRCFRQGNVTNFARF
jgi:hypothetical protein